MSYSLEALRKWEIPGAVELRIAPGGSPRLDISTRLATAQIYLRGGHLTLWQPTGFSPVIFLSERSHFAAGKPIRGGVPICFPWFGPHSSKVQLPMHGFARTSPEWELESTERWPDDRVAVVLRLVVSEATTALWPHDFVCRFRLIVGRTLEMALEVENWSSEPFTYEEALHTYLAVRDVQQTRITGLLGTEYLDKTNNFQRKREAAEHLVLTGETDRVYLNTTAPCAVHDDAGARTIRVSKEGSATTVVWNPWETKSATIADLAPDEWPRFVCIETANAAENAITLAPGATHTLRATIAVEND